MVHRRARLAAACLTLLAAGCVERGDFGRVKPSVWNDVVAGTGSLAAASRGEPVSPFAYTDDEGELRGRAWRFLVPAQDRPWLDRALAELVATRVLPPEAAPPDLAAYHAGLLAEAGRSPAPLYRRLSEDAAADLRLLTPFAATATRVLEADRVRVAALDAAGAAGPAEAHGALARVAENRCLIAWVAAATRFRSASYAFALDRLVIATPQADAVPTERTLARFAAARALLDGLGVPPLDALACAGERPRSAPAALAVVAKG